MPAHRCPAAGARRAARFLEKPERAVAEQLLAEGGWYWNSGIFLFRADRILAELGVHAPAILQATARAYAALSEVPGGAFEVPEDAYAAVPAAPIDKAVMEHAERIAVLPCDPGWSDLGSWQALWEQLPQDASGNAVRGPAFLDGSADCLVHAESRMVACAGVRDLAVIETPDAVLVSDRRDTDAGRRLVALLQQAGRAEARRTPRSSDPGAVSACCTRVRASRSRRSWSRPAAASACRATSTAPSTGWWSPVPRASPWATRS